MADSTVLLDTNVFSFLGKSGDRRGDIYRPHVENNIVAVSFVTVAELYFGARKDNWTKAKLDRLNLRLKSIVIIPYDNAVCDAYARIKAGLPKGRTIADNDTWIAACAVRHSIPLVTHNPRHFEDFKELIVISELQVIKEISSQGEFNLIQGEVIANEQEQLSSQSENVSPAIVPRPARRRP